MSRSISSLSQNMTRMRAQPGVAAQSGCAAAAATHGVDLGRTTSAARAVCSPSAGLNTGPNRPLPPVIRCPPMKCPMSCMPRPP